MTFLSRIGRLLRADVHALLDQLEEPKLILDQAMRDMDEALQHERRSLTDARARLARLEERHTALSHHLARTREELDTCLASESLDLARELIRKRLQLDREAENLRADIDSARASVVQKEAQVVRNAERLAQMQLRRERAASSDNACDHAVITDADVEIALLQARQERESRCVSP